MNAVSGAEGTLCLSKVAVPFVDAVAALAAGLGAGAFR